MKTRPVQMNFTGGEWSPRLHSRSDLAKYWNALEEMENFLILPQGGATRRPGWHYVCEVKDSDKFTRLIPFVFSNVQAYVIEAGEEYFRFYMNHGQILLAGNPCEVTTPYAEAELPAINTAQSADVLWLVHGSHKPATLSRAGHTFWTLADVPFTSMPDWSAEKGWPQACAFHEQRFCYGGTKTYPQMVWLSRSASFHDFTVSDPVVDDDACAFYLPGDQVDGIYWLCSSRALFAGTAAGEIRIFGGESGITPTSIDSKNENFERCFQAAPLRIGSVILFIQKYARKLRELAYVFTDDAFHAPDLSLLAEHITAGGISSIAYQQEPHSIVWAVRGGGVLLSLSYLREEEIVGWARQTTDGEIESVAVIPDPTGQFDEVWAVIKRIVGGRPKRYIEYLDAGLQVDSGLTYSGAATNTVTGLSHLNGKTVHIVGDGFVYPPQVVSGGSVTLDGPPASEIQVGLPFTSRMVTMKPNLQGGTGTTAGLPKKWAEIFISLLESSGLTVNGETVPFRAVGDPMATAITPFTGEKSVSQLGWGDGRITVEQSQPLPCTVRAIFGELEIGS